MIPFWNISRWTEQVTPFMLRKEKMLAWLVVLLAPMIRLKAEFQSFRATIRTIMEPNAQTISLEWHLNNLFDPTSRRIYIVSGSELVGDTIIYNAAEAQTDPFIYNSAETPTIQAYIHKSSEYFTGNFFVVYVPTSAYNDRIPFQIKLYKLGGTTFKIVLT